MVFLPRVPTTGLLLCVVLLGVTSGQSLQESLDAVDQQLATLTNRVASLAEQLVDHLKDQEGSRYGVGRLAKRMDHFEDTTGGCEVGFFPCNIGPFGSVQCVRSYLVCDGSADCKNEADEDTNLCENPFAEAISMPVLAFENHCDWVMEWPEHQPDWLIIPEVAPWFPSRPRLYWRYHYRLPIPGMTGSASLTSWADYDYATGDMLLDFHPSHRVTGRIWRDAISAQKTRYVFKLHRAHSSTKEQCMSVVAVLENA